jgi:hypothetical protein
MQRAANFHDKIADTDFAQAVGVVDNAAALDTAVDMLDAYAPSGDAPVRTFLRSCEDSAPRLLGRHDDLHLVEREGQEAEILKQPAARGQGVGCHIRNPLIVGAAGIGVTQKQDRQGAIDQQHVFHRMVSFLAAITARLLSWILGAHDAPFGAIMAKRGEAGGSVGVGGLSVGTTSAAASAAATPTRVASSLTDRVGASPSTCRVVCSTTRRT